MNGMSFAIVKNAEKPVSKKLRGGTSLETGVIRLKPVTGATYTINK